MKSHQRGNHGCCGSAKAATDVATDPVCRMEVEIAAAPAKAESGGRAYYFCSAQCRNTFLADPARYAANAG